LEGRSLTVEELAALVAKQARDLAELRGKLAQFQARIEKTTAAVKEHGQNLCSMADRVYGNDGETWRSYLSDDL
jgi:uncharacterized coiled-coil protein SlyX